MFLRIEENKSYPAEPPITNFMALGSSFFAEMAEFLPVLMVTDVGSVFEGTHNSDTSQGISLSY